MRSLRLWLRSTFLTERLAAIFWQRTPRHPLLVVRFMLPPPLRRRAAWLNSMLVSVGGTAAVIISFIWIPLLAALLLLLAGSVIFGGTVCGLAAAVIVTRNIRREQHSPAREALTHIMPPGRLGIAWLLAVRALRLKPNRGAFRLVSVGIQLAQWTMVGFGGLTTFLVAIVPLLSLGPAYAYGAGDLISAAVLQISLFVLLVIWIVLDHRQGIITGVVCGLWGSTVGSRTPESVLYAGGLFAALNIGCALVALMFMGLTSAIIESATSADSFVLFPISIAIGIAAALALRELVLRWLWARVCARMGADGTEIVLV